MVDDESRQLTLADPVDPETLAKLSEVENAKLQVGAQLLELEQDRVRLLAAAHRLEEQRMRVYEKILIDRGVTGHEPVEIDAETGAINLMRPGAQEAASPESPEDPPPES